MIKANWILNNDNGRHPEIEPGAPSHPEAAQVAASSVYILVGSPSFGFREVFS